MTEDPQNAYLAAAAALLGLPIRPEHEAEVLVAWRMIQAQARLVTEFDLPETVEAAPRFTP